MKLRAIFLLLAMIGLLSASAKWVPSSCIVQKQKSQSKDQSQEPFQLDVAQVLVACADFVVSPFVAVDIQASCQSSLWIFARFEFPVGFSHRPFLSRSLINALFRGYVVKNAP